MPVFYNSHLPCETNCPKPKDDTEQRTLEFPLDTLDQLIIIAAYCVGHMISMEVVLLLVLPLHQHHCPALILGASTSKYVLNCWRSKCIVGNVGTRALTRKSV